MQVDEFGTPQAFQLNAELEFPRNKERYAFLRWGQTAFKNFAIVPPDTGIVHQINLEYLARVVFVGANGESGKPLAYPDTLVGTDSHTTMINGLGVLGWGVGGIEAEAAMLGQPVSMLIPQVVGVRLNGQLREGSTATDLVLTVTEMLRKKGVVGKFVEFFGPGLHDAAAGRSRHHQPTWRPSTAPPAASSPSTTRRCATCASPAAAKSRSRWSRRTTKSRDSSTPRTRRKPSTRDVLDLDLASVEPSIAGPKRPQDRVPLSQAAESFEEALPSLLKPGQQVPPKQDARWETKADIPPAWTRSRTAVEEHVDAGRGAEPRQRGHRRHHQLHQHLEPVGADGRRTAGEEGGREGPEGSRVGEDVARARLEGRDRVPHALRPAALPREAEVPPRRLRLHDLHRQLGPAAAGSFERGHRAKTWWSPRC